MSEVHVSGGGGWVALAILYVMFTGDPDLWDALMAYLQAGGAG